MSKSKGNFYTARDVFEGKVLDENGQPCGIKFHPAVLRFELIKSHYRDNMNFTLEGLKGAKKVINRLMHFRQDLESRTGGESETVDLTNPVLKKFAEALADDLNISAALAVMHTWVKGDHPNPQESLGVWKKINSVLSIAPINEGADELLDEADDSGMTIEEAHELCKQMDVAKQNKDYDTSDAIRKKITDAGYEVQQSADGSTIKKQLV